MYYTKVSKFRGTRLCGCTDVPKNSFKPIRTQVELEQQIILLFQLHPARLDFKLLFNCLFSKNAQVQFSQLFFIDRRRCVR